MSYVNVNTLGLGAAPAARRPLASRYRRVSAPRAVRRPDGSMLFLVPKRGVGDVVTTRVNGMPETTQVLDTASYIQGWTAQDKLTNWGWVTPDAYRTDMISKVSNRCSLYTDSCAGIGKTMAEWVAYVDGTLMPPYVAWYTQAMADFMAKSGGLTPDQANAAGAAATEAYNQTLSANAGGNIYDAQLKAQNAAAAVQAAAVAAAASGQQVVTAAVMPQQVQQTIQPTMTTGANTGGTGASSSTGGGGANPAPPPVSAASLFPSDFFNNSFNIAGYSVPIWALGAGVVGLMLLPSFMGRGR